MSPHKGQFQANICLSIFRRYLERLQSCQRIPIRQKHVNHRRPHPPGHDPPSFPPGPAHGHARHHLLASEQSHASAGWLSAGAPWCRSSTAQLQQHINSKDTHHTTSEEQMLLNRIRQQKTIRAMMQPEQGKNKFCTCIHQKRRCGRTEERGWERGGGKGGERGWRERGWREIGCMLWDAPKPAYTLLQVTY